jgi:hypothetical protein
MQAPPVIETPRMRGVRIGPEHHAASLSLLGDEQVGATLGAASLDLAFGPLGLGSVVAYTLPHNIASRRVMEKLGLGYEREVVYADLPHVLYRRYSPGSR